MDMACSDTQALCRFFHTSVQFVDGCICVTVMFRVPLSAMASMWSALYTRLLKVLGVFSGPGGAMYATSSV